MECIKDLKWCVKEYGILKGIYFSDIFNPLYKLINFFPNLIYDIKKYHYYGKAGLSTQDFDFNEYTLLKAHLERVLDYMMSNKTHLMWNSKKDCKSMRKLKEAYELASRIEEAPDYSENWHSMYKQLEVKQHLEPCSGRPKFYNVNHSYNVPEKRARLLLNIARKKDESYDKFRKQRLRHLIDKYGRSWWD